jgi:hypothetical protein
MIRSGGRARGHERLTDGARVGRDTDVRGPRVSNVQGARGALATRSQINGPGPTNRANRYPHTWAIKLRLNGQDRAPGEFISSGRPGSAPFAPLATQPSETR